MCVHCTHFACFAFSFLSMLSELEPLIISWEKSCKSMALAINLCKGVGASTSRLEILRDHLQGSTGIHHLERWRCVGPQVSAVVIRRTARTTPGELTEVLRFSSLNASTPHQKVRWYHDSVQPTDSPQPSTSCD